MKHTRIIFVLCALLAMGAMVMGCEPESYNQKTEEKEPTGGGSTTGDGGKEDDGGKTDDKTYSDGSDIDVSSFETYSSTFTSCGYQYTGTFDDIDGYILYFADNDYDWVEEEGEGTWAIAELFVKSGEGIAPGKYCINDTMDKGTVYICEVGDDDTVSGTMYGEGEYAYVCPSAGYIEIEKTNDNYKISIRFIDETYEGLFTGSFSGPISEYNFSDDDDDDEGGDEGDYPDIEDFGGFTKCEAEFYGDYDGAGDWVLYFGDDDTDMSAISGSWWAMAELFTSSTSYSTGLPEGTFTIDDSEEAGTIGSIYSDGEYYYGTMFGYDDSIYV
ncbi:MAG: hypothetical protein MJY56_06010, partial [Bacteroidales bacterium]|nr:hypothetical protein [Bacteroidales bacterium]